MENVLCILEGLLQDNKLIEARDFYRDHKGSLPVIAQSNIELELFKRDLEKGVLKIRNKEDGRTYALRQWDRLFPKEVR